MKNKTLLVALTALASVVILSGCKENTSPSSSGSGISRYTVSSFTGALNSRFDTVHVYAALRFSESKHMATRDGGANYVVTAQSGFSDGHSLQNINAVTVNGATLTHANLGQYVTQNPSLYTTGPLSWSVSGFGPGPFSPSQSSPTEISFTGVHAYDTVSKSAGFTLAYSGAQAGADLFVSCLFDAGETWQHIDENAAKDGGTQNMIFTSKSDDGSVSISADQLSGFRPGTCITLTIFHCNADIQQASNGKNVAIVSSYATSIPLYLSN